VNHAFEADVLRARGKGRTHELTVRFKTQLEAERIRFAADKAGKGMGQRLLPMKLDGALRWRKLAAW
jgi:hypothetical protein